MDKLKPCPFCGSERVYKNGNWEVACPEDDCGVIVLCGESDEEMVQVWNRRAEILQTD